MKIYLTQLQHYWSQRSSRERQLLILLGAFLLISALASLLFKAHDARQRLLQKRPLLQQQLMQLKHQAQDLPRLQAQALPAQPNTGTLLTTARQLLQTSGLSLPEGSLQSAGPHQLQLNARLPFDLWLAALAQLQSSMTLRLTRCQITADKTATGLVHIDAVFALPEPQ